MYLLIKQHKLPYTTHFEVLFACHDVTTLQEILLSIWDDAIEYYDFDTSLRICSCFQILEVPVIY